MPSRLVLMLLLSIGFVLASGANAQSARTETGIAIQNAGTDKACFTRNGEPLLSFGGLSDFAFFGEEAYDWKLWADWAADHGMNHLRAYPPLSTQTMEDFFKENKADFSTAVFPYQRNAEGRFDLTRPNPQWWSRFREQMQYLQDRGIVVHFLLYNGWEIGRSDDWSGHLFNPKNNVNYDATYFTGKNPQWKFFETVADGRDDIVALQKAHLDRLLEATAGLDNVYYDLVHEAADARDEKQWAKTQAWIDAMSSHVREKFRELNDGREIVLGMDTGGMSEDERNWIFAHPNFDILVYGKAHRVPRAIAWRTEFDKPYVPQEIWDDNGKKWGYRNPEHRDGIRKYMWKFMMAKCQQMDLYIKPRKGDPDDHDPAHNYDPRGRNAFEDDALHLRAFWDRLTDYPNLGVDGQVTQSPLPDGAHQMVLSSPREAVVYLSSPTRAQGVAIPAGDVVVEGMSLADGEYRATLFDPKAGAVDERVVHVRGGRVELTLPGFTDDLAVHVLPTR